MDYYNKYIKYKNKYIQLKNQIGGFDNIESIVIHMMTFEDFGMINNLTKKEEGFKQTDKTKLIFRCS